MILVDPFFCRAASVGNPFVGCRAGPGRQKTGSALPRQGRSGGGREAAGGGGGRRGRRGRHGRRAQTSPAVTPDRLGQACRPGLLDRWPGSPPSREKRSPIGRWLPSDVAAWTRPPRQDLPAAAAPWSGWSFRPTDLLSCLSCVSRHDPHLPMIRYQGGRRAGGRPEIRRRSTSPGGRGRSGVWTNRRERGGRR